MKKIYLLAFTVALFIVSQAQPLNDDCINATPITIPASGSVCINSTNVAATATNWANPICGQTNWQNDVWFTFVSNGSLTSVTVIPAGGSPAQQVGVAVFTGGCLNPTGTGIYCGVSPNSTDSVRIVQAGAAGVQYWVEVSSFIAAGTFRICVNSSTPPPAPGTSCATATSVCDLSSFTLPTGPAGTGNYDPSCFTLGATSSVWYQFTAGTAGTLAWSCDPLLANTELDWALFDITGGCAPANLNANTLRCNYNYTTQGSFPVGMSTTSGTICPSTGLPGTAPGEFCPSLNLVAGRTYAIMIDNFSANSSGWNFSWAGSTFQMAPTASFTVTPPKVCGSSGTATINNTSVAASTYLWNFGDGSPTSTSAAPGTHNYTAPGTYVISLTANTPAGCSDVTSQSFQVIPNPILTTVSDTICPGFNATISVSADITGGTYSWSGGAGNTASVTVSPATTSTYTVTYTSPDNCTATATATVNVLNANFTVNAGVDTTICTNQTIVLNGSVNPAGSYTYAWSPNGSLTNASTLTPTASPISSTVYILTVTDVNGCSVTDNVLVSVNGIGVPVNASVTPAIVCPGQQVILRADAIPTTCGPTVLCNGNSLSDTIIGGPYVNQPGTSTQSPTLLGNFLRSGRNQMLYTAAELNTVLGGPCTIRTISFFISIFNSNAFLQNFAIKVACTSTNALNNWEGNLITVFTSAAFQPSAGVNNFNLSTPFAWDGVSNLVVDICWNNPSTFGNQNNKALCANTAFNSYLSLFGSTDMCGTATAPTVSTLRPAVRFNYCIPDINDYTILWTPNTGPNTVAIPDSSVTPANPLTTQSYTINVSNGGCTGSDVVTVQVDTSRVSAGPDKSTCPGVSVPLLATVIGTVLPGPASFVWTTLSGTNVGNTQNINVSPATNTTYVVTMNGGSCIKRDTIMVSVTGLTVTPTVTNITCWAQNNGKIKLTHNGTAPFSYVWSANANTLNRDSAVSLPPGTYQVTVTDASGCTGTASASVTEPTQITYTQVITNIYCFGGNNGQIALSTSGGTPPYTFAWNNGLPANDTVSNLTAGAYSVTITDVNGCQRIGNLSVSSPPQLVFGAPQIKDARCFNGNDGYIIVSASGGSGGLTYNWSHNGTLHSTNATGLTAGVYNITVLDAGGCSASTSYTVSQPATGLTLNPSTVVDVTCFGGNNGSATANPNGGVAPYVYTWNTTPAQSTQTASGLTAQIYQVIVTDDSLCTASATVSVGQPPQITIAGNVTNVQCNGVSDAAINITVSNGATPVSYVWSNGALTEDIFNIPVGTYTVDVTDNTSCTASASFTVTQPAPLVLNSPSISNVSCLGGSNGSITANGAGGTGPYNYTWSNGGSTSTISGITAGAYYITFADANGCSVTDIYQVTEPATAVLFGAPVIIDVLCNGETTGSIVVSVTGGTGSFTYSWSHNNALNSATALNLAAGTYTVTATDANQCSVSSQYSIIEPTAITFGSQTITNVSCNGGSNGSAQVTPTGGTGTYTYAWNGVAGSNPLASMTAGNYTVLVTDANSCTATASVVISEPAALVVQLFPVDALCSGASNGSITATVSGGNQPYVYIWSDPLSQTTQTATQLSAGSYQVTVTDNTGCTFTTFGTVGEPGGLTLSATTVQVKCNGDTNGSITLSSSGGTQPFTYGISTDGVNYTYSSSPQFDNLASGNYFTTVTDANSCGLQGTAFVAAPVADIVIHTVDSTSCYGTAYTDGAIHVLGNTIQNMPYQYAVDDGNFSYSGDFFNLSAGAHTVTIQNYWECTSIFTTVVPEPLNGLADILPHDTIIQLGNSVQLFATLSPYSVSSITSYSWSPTVGLNCLDCANPIATPFSRLTDYVVTVTYNNNCFATASIQVTVENNLPVFIPNSFTPNGDGNNDVFQIFGQGIKTVDLKIFNRWGEKVYESSNQYAGWDGTFKGELQNPSVFAYTVRITFLDDKKIDKVGSITLVR